MLNPSRIMLNRDTKNTKGGEILEKAQVNAEKNEARDLLVRIEKLGTGDKKTILAALKGMLAVVDVQKSERA